MNTPESEQKRIIAVESTLADDFGFRVDRLTALTQTELGDNSEVFSGSFEGQKVFVKALDGQHHYNLQVLGSQLLGEHGIPVPQILKSKEKTRYLNKPMIVETTVPGVSLSKITDPEERAKIYESAGKMLRKINEIKLLGFGKIIEENGRVHGRSATWKEAEGWARPKFEYLMENGFIDHSELQLLEEVQEFCANADVSQAHLLHGDYQAAHIFTDGKEVTGVIDFGALSLGDPRVDIAKTQFYIRTGEDQPALDAFNQGYGDLTKDPLVQKYLLLNAARKVIYRHSHNFPDRIPKALEVLKASLAEAK